MNDNSKTSEKWQTPLFVAILSIVVSSLVSLGFRVMDQRDKEKWTAYEHKEVRYQNLIQAARVFQTSAYLQDSVELQKKFLEEVDLCLMYCPDEVLQSTWGLLDRMRPGNSAHYPGDDGTGSLKSILYAIRKDMFSEVGKKTKITPDQIYLTSLVLAKNPSGKLPNEGLRRSRAAAKGKSAGTESVRH